MFRTRQPTVFDVPGAGLVVFTGNPPLPGLPCAADLGDADTIVERLATATPGVPTIPVEIVALELRSRDPIDLGNGPETIFASLNADDGTSTMTINGLNGGPKTVDSQLDFTVDLVGGISGFISTEAVSIAGTGNAWRTFGVPGGLSALCSAGFSPLGRWEEEHIAANEQKHSVSEATSPPVVMPTLSEWGMVVLTLLIAAMGVRFVAQRRLQPAAAGGAVTPDDPLRFDTARYALILGAGLVAALLGMLLVGFTIGVPGPLDVAGTLVSVALIAYMLLLWDQLRRS